MGKNRNRPLWIQQTALPRDCGLRFIGVDKLPTTTREEEITSCKSQFTRHGIPITLISDNGPQFSSHKFHELSTFHQFEHRTRGRTHNPMGKPKRLCKSSRILRPPTKTFTWHYSTTKTHQWLTGGIPSSKTDGKMNWTPPLTTHRHTSQNHSTARGAIRIREAKISPKNLLWQALAAFAPLEKVQSVTFQNGGKWVPATITQHVEVTQIIRYH